MALTILEIWPCRAYKVFLLRTILRQQAVMVCNIRFMAARAIKILLFRRRFLDCSHSLARQISHIKSRDGKAVKADSEVRHLCIDAH